MSDPPDPLGKRALFWAPAQRQEAGPMRPGKRVLPGRHALFSGGDPEVAASVTPKKSRVSRAPLAGTTRPPVAARPARLQRATTKSVASTKPIKTIKTARPAPSARAAKAVKAVKAVRAVDAAPAESRGGPISLSCSKCGTHTNVDILKYMVLHLPYWVWRPGRGYTSLMKCPACSKRTWLSASWGPAKD